MAEDHPLAKKKLTLERYLEYSHVEVSLGGREGTLIDKLLRKQGRVRNVGLRSAHVLSVLPIVEKTQLLFTTAWRLLEKGERHYALVAKPIPLEMPLAEYSVVWHPKDDDSAANRWLRELIIRVATQGVSGGRV